MIKIGIECESIESSEQWGVGRIVSNLLKEISKRPELKKEFKFFLYFKSSIPNYPYLSNDIFVKKIVPGILSRRSFSLYYYVWLPIKLWFEKLEMMYFPNYMLPIIFHGRSMVTLTEDLHYEITKGNLPFRYKIAYKIFCGWAARHATRVVAVSEASKNEVAKAFHISSARIAVVPNAVGKIESTNIIPHEGNYILYLGQGFPRRHLRETILAFEKLNKDFSDLKLIAVGKDKYAPPIIKNLVSDVNNHLGEQAIIYKEYVSEDEKESLMKGAKAFMYISDNDAFGLPPLEALGYGAVPVVGSLPATREIFGDMAFFVSQPITTDSVAAAIKEALTDQEKRQRIKASAQEILGRYTWQKHTDRFLEVVREVVRM